MSKPTFDLQSHSTSSDGALPPAAVVAAAHEAGVELLALSDHDTVDGLDEAFAAAAATDGGTAVAAGSPFVESSLIADAGTWDCC